jgi:hypothetical protein
MILTHVSDLDPYQSSAAPRTDILGLVSDTECDTDPAHRYPIIILHMYVIK